MSDVSLKGIVPAVVTPFRDDELIDYAAWLTIIESLIASGVHGLLAIGGQGEFFSLTEEEREVGARFCAQTVAGRVPVYVNVGSVTTQESIRLAQKAQADGVDAVVVITPYYLKPSPDELADHYIEICRSVRIPVLAYNIPERTGVELNPSILRDVASSCENFVGLKDSSGRLDEILEYRALGLTVFIGRDHMIYDGLKLGCSGAVAACANVAPRVLVDLFTAFQAGDMEKSQHLQKLIEPLRHAFGLATFPSVIKEAMNMMGLHAGRCRKPVGRMTGESRAKLAAILESLRQAGYLPDATVQLRAV